MFGMFVVAGSLLLLAWLRHQQQAEAERVFLTLARNDADFVKRLNLPRSPKLAGDLSQLLRMDIHFRASGGGPVEPAPDAALAQALAANPPRDAVLPLAGGRQAVVLALDAAHEMIFVQPAAAPTLSLFHPATRNALLAFWLLSGLLGWFIARQVVRPVGRLTGGLKGFFDSPAQVPAESARRDEIGLLARALTQARDELLAERQKREQSEKLALLGRVATGLAHEIKNPLASIQLHAELMQPEGLDAESAQSLRHIQAEVKVIEGLVNQWLYLARPAPPRRVPVALEDLLRETLAALRPQADHAGATLEFRVQGGSPAVFFGDRPRLQQALRNVVLNGLQAMPGGGVLHVQLNQGAAEAELVFHDSGPGFSPEALARGSELFFSEKEGGMGVGLNVVHEIICAHGGQLMLKNGPEGGAVVRMVLPLGKS